jgi:hypothetical protein
MTIPEYDICDCGKRGVHSKCNDPEPGRLALELPYTADFSKSVSDHFLKIAEDVWTERYGALARVNGWTPKIKLVRLKDRECTSLLGTRGTVVVIEATAEMGGIKSTFSFHLDGDYFEYEDEKEV